MMTPPPATAPSTLDRRPLMRRRAALAATLRGELLSMGYDEVETPLLVPAPGMEPAIQAFGSRFVPELGGLTERPLWLHTSPEYAMKRLLADGWERLFQLCKVFRNGEVSPTHNPEFTLLEFYRAGIDYHALMDDLERLVKALHSACGGGVLERGGCRVEMDVPFERLTVREAMRRETGLDIAELQETEALRAAARAAGYPISDGATSWDDVFFSVFVSAVEPRLGATRPTFLIEYPAHMAALARLKPGEPLVAERFELYAAGLELANGFSELTDGAEQRQRLVQEQEERRAAGREVYPLDERFLEAVGRMPAASGVAVGFDRLAMLLLGVERIEELLLFPAVREWA